MAECFFILAEGFSDCAHRVAVGYWVGDEATAEGVAQRFCRSLGLEYQDELPSVTFSCTRVADRYQLEALVSQCDRARAGRFGMEVQTVCESAERRRAIAKNAKSWKKNGGTLDADSPPGTTREQVIADSTSSSAQRLRSLLGKIRDGLRQTVDSLRGAADGVLPGIDVDSDDIDTAAVYLHDMGLRGDALRLRAVFRRYVKRSTDEILAAMADGESKERRDCLTEACGVFPIETDPHHPAVIYRRTILAGQAAILANHVDELIGTLTSKPSGKDATEEAKVLSPEPIGIPPSPEAIRAHWLDQAGYVQGRIAEMLGTTQLNFRRFCDGF